MDWFASLPSDLQKWLLDVAGKATASMVATLATRLIDASSNRLRRAFQDDPKQAALQRAVSQALAAALSIFPLDDALIDHYLSVFAAWLDREAVVDELAKLLEPGEENLDRELLRAEFVAAGFDPDWLGSVDFDAMLDMLVAGFATAARQETELIEPLKVKYLEQMAERMGALQRLAEYQAASSRQAVTHLARIDILTQQIADGQDVISDLLLEVVSSLNDALHQDTVAQQSAYEKAAMALDRAGLGDSLGPELAQIKGLLQRICDSITTSAPSLTAGELAKMETNYRERLVEQFQTLTFKGMSPSGRPIALPLEQVYVELKAVADVPEAADTFSADERRLLLEAEERGEGARAELALHLDSLRVQRWREAARLQESRLQRRSISEIVADPGQRGVVILGDPGSGKTTLLHYLALIHARRDDSQPVAVLPIFVPLAAYDDYLRRNGDGMPLGDFLALYFERWRSLPGLGPVFREALEQGRALVLLDGLDEVLETGARQYVAEQAGALINQWAPRGNRFAITSRIVGYREARLSGNLPHVTVLDFGRPEIELFAHQWCRTYEIWAADGKETPTALQSAAAEEKLLLDDVRSNPSVERLAANPLLLTMLALLRRQVGRLPDRRIELYERYVDTLIVNWEPARSGGARLQTPARFDPHVAIHHLIELALWLQQNRPSGTARREDVEIVLADICLRYEGEDPERVSEKACVEAQQQASRFLADMRYFAGLIGERGRDAFGFLHLTFQEYFAGRALARMKSDARWAMIQPNLHKARWREPILLCAGQLGVRDQRQDEATDLVRSILSAGSEHEEILHRDTFLAAAVAADDVGIAASLRDEIAARLAPLAAERVPAVRDAALNGLAQLARLGVVPALESLSRFIEDERSQGYALDSVSGVLAAETCAQLRRSVTAKLEARDNGVRMAAVQALAPLVPTDAAARQAVTAKLEDGDHFVRMAAVQALAPLVPTDAAARQAVTAKLEDGDQFVRSAAVQALAPLVPTDAAARLAVTAKLEDGNNGVRRAAVQALASLVPTDAAARQAVTAKLEDGNQYVRSAAVQALASLVPTDAAARQAVTAKLEDGDWQMRSAAVQALASLVPTDAAARQAVTAKLEDGDENVRSAAVQALASLVPTDAAARQAVTAKLEDGDENVRSAAVQALASLVPTDAAARQAVTAKLEDRDNDVRSAAVQALAPLVPTDAAARQAVAIKLEDRFYDVWSAAVQALAPLVPTDAAARQAVTAKLEDGDENVRSAAVQALAPLVPTDAAARQAVTGKLEDGNQYVRSAAVQALASLVPTDAAARQAVTAKLEDGNQYVRSAAVQALASLVPTDAAARQAVTAKLEDGDHFVRMAAVQALAPLVPTDAAARQAVTAKLEDGDQFVRSAAVQALAPLVPTDAAARLAVTAKLEDGNNGVRRAAVQALASLVPTDAAARQAVTGKLEDGDWQMRSAAVQALAPLVPTDAAARQAVTAKLEDGDENVRSVAVQALAPLVPTDAAARQAVTGKLEDGFCDVRMAAVQALVPLVPTNAEIRDRLLPWLGFAVDGGFWPDLESTEEEIRRLLADTYAPLLAADRTLQLQVAAMLDSIAWPVRQGAAWGLIAMPGGPPPELLPKLRGLLGDMRGEESWPNRLQVAELLINDRDRVLSGRAIAAALEALDYATQPWYYLPRSGPEVRKQAATILGILEPLYRDDAIFARLARVMAEDDDEDVRDAAYSALLRLAAAPEEKA